MYNFIKVPNLFDTSVYYEKNLTVMKTKAILISMLCSVFLTFAQEKPQKVNSIVKEPHDFEWFTQQYSLWGKELKKDSKNGDAWINFYAAARMARYTAKDENEKTVWTTKESEVVPQMEKAIKGTFAYYRIMAWYYSIWKTHDKKEQEKIAQYSLKAYELNPLNPDIYPTLMNIYEILTPNSEKLKEVAIRWKESGHHSPNLMARAYNSLINAKEKAILMTGGDNDTYPLWIAQCADNFRKDVHVWNIYLITNPEYRNRLFKELNIPALEGDVEISKIIEHIIKNRGDLPLYFSNKGIVAKDSAFYEKLYNVGVIYQYSEEMMDNTALIVNHFENKFLLDHVKYNFYQSEFPEMDRNHNYSYLPGLMALYQHYYLIENNEKAKKTKDLLIQLTKGTPYFEDIKVQLNLE